MKKGILILLVAGNAVYAASPVWTFTPLTATNISVPSNGTAVVQYTVTNKSRKSHTLVMNSIPGIAQDTSGSNCKNPFILAYQQSCTLKLDITGSQLGGNVNGGPVVCEQASQGLQCYQPNLSNVLNITLASPITSANIGITGSPLTLTVNGSAGTITVNNTSSDVAATNVTALIASTALNGKVTVNDSACTSVPPLGSCILSFTPLSTPVSATAFNIQGANTNAVNASITIQSSGTLTSMSPTIGSASGGVGVTLTGTGLTGTTGVLFDGVPATSVNVVNSTTITAVTPPHAAGAVNVQTSGGALLTNGFTYQTTAVGQSAYGGKIACLNGGLNNLIAAASDNNLGIEWGGYGISVGVGAQSITDGNANSTAIINCLTNGVGCAGTPPSPLLSLASYAAGVCRNYQVDSLNNTPCQAGNTCYNDWFLPSGRNTTTSGQIQCMQTNKTAIGGFTGTDYWSSTETTSPEGSSPNEAWYQYFVSPVQTWAPKSNLKRVRCVRAFNP